MLALVLETLHPRKTWLGFIRERGRSDLKTFKAAPATQSIQKRYYRFVGFPAF